MGVVTAIYTNLTNKSKDNLRYSAATRIATQIAENIQSKCYDEVIHRCSKDTLKTVEYLNGSTNRDANGGKIFDVKVPVGYSATVTSSTAKEVDIVRSITVMVKYKISGSERNVTLYLTKQRELLEQTNKPDLTMLDDYASDGQKYYPIKKSGSDYVVTAMSDPGWYNYDTLTKRPALIVKSETAKNIGDTFTVASLTSSQVFVWVPRYGQSGNALTFLYGSSGYKIQFGKVAGDKLIGYYISGTGSDTDFSMGATIPYYSSTFTANDGKTGIWYCLTQSNLNSGDETTTYNQLKTYYGDSFNDLPV